MVGAGGRPPWRIEDQAATTDVLTTHPYSLWTAHTSQDGINTMRTLLHAAAETRLYGDLGGKPALTEETGVMGPMTGDEKEKAAFARTALFSNWAHDCIGTLWWCAYDQLSFPYSYSSVENELRLIRKDRTPKPVLAEFKNFSQFLDKLPFKTLPARKAEAVCILTEGQDTWGVGYTSFVLEQNLTVQTGAFDPGQPAYANIYREIAYPLLAGRVLTQSNPCVGVTEHTMSATEKVVVLVNYSPQDVATTAQVRAGWKIASVLYDLKPAATRLTLKANDTLVLTLRRK